VFAFRLHQHIARRSELEEGHYGGVPNVRVINRQFAILNDQNAVAGEGVRNLSSVRYGTVPPP
jgi:hypothetical protein